MDLSRLDKFTMSLAPRWTLARMRARMAIRHYEAAQPGRRTQGWARSYADANKALQMALVELRIHARDLCRNNAYAKRGRQVIANHTVGWGVVPKATGPAAERVADLWKQWAKECDSEERHSFYGIQRLVMQSLVESGEVLIRRRPRRPSDGLAVPLQLQILESDFLDHSRNLAATESVGPTIQGVEFDLLGRRSGYWLYEEHPGSGLNTTPSRRIPATDILHIFYVDRPGQVRGASWFGAAIVPLKDFDGFEDATLLRQKIAACFAAFVTDTDGSASPLGAPSKEDPGVQTFEPGMISSLPPGKDVTFANPPMVTSEDFTTRTLRKVASALGITYEDLSGDFSNVNFSSARMARLEHWANITDWRWNMLIPQLCDGVWNWFVEAAQLGGMLPAVPVNVEWTAPPMPMIEPDKEGLALQRLVRTGAMTHDEMVREQGQDPDAHWADYAAGLKRLDSLGITLDSDARKTTAAGQEQQSQAPADPASTRAVLEILNEG